MTDRESRHSAYWDREATSFAHIYDRAVALHPRHIVRWFLEGRSRVLSEMMPWREGDLVLDVGCGSGVHASHLAGVGVGVVGLDRSFDMLRAARRSPARKALRQFARADAHHVPCRSGRFDGVVSLGVLDYLDSPEAALAECRRALKPQGIAIVTLPRSPSPFGILRTRAGEAIKRLVFDLPPVPNVYTRSALAGLCQQARFEVVEVRSLWKAMWIVKARRLE